MSMAQLAEATTGNVLLVIPCFNEARHIEGLLKQLVSAAHPRMTIVVADGRSTDASARIVQAFAARDSAVKLVDNPQRIQSAGINRAVELYGDDADVMIRIDAHSAYPADYCRILLEEAERTGADAVVVGMRTVGTACFQRAAAGAQNSRLGTGGSSHRVGAGAMWVDHGHHALIRIEAFRAIGGYDETFATNEDAEFDIRLRKQGGTIWLTDRVRPIYFPRDTVRGLFRQYRKYGAGRLRTQRKHRLPLKLRQLLPSLVVPSAVAAILSPVVALMGYGLLALALAVPTVLWLLACLGFGALLAFRQEERCVLLSGPAAIVMHFAWSLGFWEAALGGEGAA